MKLKKKLLFVLPTLNIGGAEKVTVNILNSLNNETFDIKLIVIDSRFKNLESTINQDIKVKYLNIEKTRNAYFFLVKEIVLFKPDIVFSSLNRTNILILLIKVIYPFFKVVIREPSIPSVQIKNGYISSKIKFIIKLLYPFANRIIAQTKYMKKDIETTYNIDEKKVVAINNPIDKVYIQNSIKGSENPFVKYQNRYNCVYVGRLSDEKNPLFLIDAFEKVVEQDDRFHLYIIGDGYLKEDILKYINEKQLQRNITILGFQSSPYTCIKFADIILLCSKWEGMPNVVIEALFLNTPVISTLSTPVLNDLIVQGKNGYLIENYDSKEFAKAILNFEQIEKKFLEFENFDFNEFFKEIQICVE